MAGATEITQAGGGAAAGTGSDFGAFLELLLGGSARPQSTPELDELRRKLADNQNESNPFVKANNQQGLEKQIAELEANLPPDRRQGIENSPIFQNLMSLIEGPDITGSEDSLRQLIEQDTEKQAANLRERFTAGGSSAGTPAAVAESRFRAEAGPRAGVAVQQLDFQKRQQQIALISQLLGITSGFGAQGFPAAENVVTQQPGALDVLATLSNFVPSVGNVNFGP